VSRLSVVDLWKGYGSGPAVLRGVDLDVPAGTLSAVLGLSGCGKTTLLRMIAGMDRARRGKIALAERTLDDGVAFVAPERRRIGYVPQEGALFPHLSVRANVGFGLSRAERRGSAVDELLEMVGLAARARRLPHQLSGGEQQRVALARALARSPDLLLLDEPFSSLDPTLRAQVRVEVVELLRARGVTTVLVTHDQEEALSLADSVAVLRDGRIVQDGSPDELYNRPVDARLARFLGAANLLDARLRDGVALTPLGPLALRGEADARAGARATVLLRPEQLTVQALQPHAAGAAGRPGIAGRVAQCRYYGHDALMQIDIVSPDPAPAASLLARVPGDRALAAGTPVSVSAKGPATVLADASGRPDPTDASGRPDPSGASGPADAADRGQVA
jgi:iron(III) transport system ATP-binding protein